jgi:hypothetical protein
MHTGEKMAEPLYPDLNGTRVGLLRSYPAHLAFCLALALFCLTAHINFRLADEGLQWYGSQRVLAGDVPLRDFLGYDPGRYYWSAAVMALLHSYGVVGVNIAAGLFGAIGLWIAFRLLYRDRPHPDPWSYTIIVVTFLVWMFPRVKLFDIASSVMLTAMLAWLMEAPTHRRCFLTGLGTGAIAIMGRNHGVYGAAADVAALVYLAWLAGRIRFLPGFCWWMLGVIVGFSPMLVAILFVPGFWTPFWAGIQVYFETGTTNRGVPFPWPWLNAGRHAAVQGLRHVLLGSLLLALPLYGLTVTAYSIWRARVRKLPVDPLLFATGLLAITYTHHAFSRPEEAHLAQAAAPMLIGMSLLLLKLPSRRSRPAAALALAVSVMLLVPSNPVYTALKDGGWVETPVGPDTLLLPRQTAARLDAFSKLLARYAPPGREIVAVPLITGVYALDDRRAAIWDVYTAFPGDAAVQKAEIARIQTGRPALVIIHELGREDDAGPAYPTTYPQVYDYIRTHFTRVDTDLAPSDGRWDVYVPRQDAPVP